jgi:hypothetical protein
MGGFLMWLFSYLRQPDEGFGDGAVVVVAIIGMFFLAARMAYVLEVRRRRRIGFRERQAENESEREG